MPGPVCVVVGAGPGNGLAFAKRFAAAGYAVALLARSEKNLRALGTALPEASPLRCDATDPQQVDATFQQIRTSLGPIHTLIYNAGAGVFGTIDDVDVATFSDAWRVNTLGCMLCVKQALSDMRAARSGTIVIVGATASKRGGARFAAFASAKAAQYSLAQSLARQLGPENIHVIYPIIDGVIDLPRTRVRFADKPADFFLRPDAIAEAVYQLAQQHPSAWTFECDLRPCGENW